MRENKRVLARMAVAGMSGMVLLVGGVLAATPAEASASGCTPVNGGVLCNSTSGDGLHVESVNAEFATGDYVPVCGTQFRVFGQLSDGSYYDSGVATADCGYGYSSASFSINQDFANGTLLCAAVKPPEQDWQAQYACNWIEG